MFLFSGKACAEALKVRYAMCTRQRVLRERLCRALCTGRLRKRLCETKYCHRAYPSTGLMNVGTYSVFLHILTLSFLAQTPELQVEFGVTEMLSGDSMAKAKIRVEGKSTRSCGSG